MDCCGSKNMTVTESGNTEFYKDFGKETVFKIQHSNIYLSRSHFFNMCSKMRGWHTLEDVLKG